MERRKFVIGLGSLAAGGAAATGTGAFTQTTTERQAEVKVVNDNDAILGLGPSSVSSSNNSEIFNNQQQGGGSGDPQIYGLELNGNYAGDGSGLTYNSEIWFDNVFEIKNQSTKDQWVHITGNTQPQWSSDSWHPYAGPQQGFGSRQSIKGSSNAVYVPSGGSVSVGLYFDTSGTTNPVNSTGESKLNSYMLTNMTITAEDNGSGSTGPDDSAVPETSQGT